MEIICPYCKNEMVKGWIDGGRYSFKWHNENLGTLEKYTVFGGEIISEKNLIQCFRCKECNKIIIDLDKI